MSHTSRRNVTFGAANTSKEANAPSVRSLMPLNRIVTCTEDQGVDRQTRSGVVTRTALTSSVERTQTAIHGSWRWKVAGRQT